MRTLWLFLLVLLWDPTSEAVELNNTVLARIVTSFRENSGIEPSVINGGGQFSFLLALTPQQCTDPNQAVSFSPSGAGAAPIIRRYPSDFLRDPLANYMAVYPNTNQTIGSRCSESKLLHLTQQDQAYGRRSSPAQRFQNLINNRPRRNRLTVGCVIFYTTYTPCINRCFSNDQNCEILTALSQAPFNTAWAQGNIQKYFVFSKLYHSDRRNIPTVRNNLRQIANVGFMIRKCDSDQDQNRILCLPCNPPGDCL